MTNDRSRIIDFLQSKHHVEGLTHNFYRYPARFAPEFAREVIMEFSREGDVVLDTFMGGGTTIVEAIANGRLACGIDINPLAHFVTRVKTTPLSLHDEEAMLSWLKSIAPSANVEKISPNTDSRLRNVPDHVKQFFVSAVEGIGNLKFPRQRRFARSALMKLGQWAIDCREELPTPDQMKKHLLKDTLEMLDGLNKLTETARSHGIQKNKITSKRFLYLGSIDDAISENRMGLFHKPRLVLTSPPYPGVHVLYHRWQIRGRRETPAPYWLADLKDGHGESYYTLGGRSEKGQREYFERLTRTYDLLRAVIDEDAVVVQLVAFSEPNTQLPRFLDSMVSAGYKELTLFRSPEFERPYRQVPNRKWYTQLGQNRHASNEVLLVHRPK
ncbi:MAG: DNA methyltransferase [Chloroflexota bacterium]